MDSVILVETFNDFIGAVAGYTNYGMPKDWRAGQGAFNLLCRIRPDLAEMVRGSDFDPFYQDKNLPDFYDFLMRHWDDGKE